MTKRLGELVELALKKELTPNTRTELVKMLFTDKDGDIWLSQLQLQDFEGNLYQHYQIVGNSLYQRHQRVNGNLSQYSQTVKGNLDQENQIVDGNLSQYGQTVKGYVIIGDDNFAGIKETIKGKDEIVKEIVKEIDPYENMNREELIEELKKVKGDQ